MELILNPAGADHRRDGGATGAAVRGPEEPCRGERGRSDAPGGDSDGRSPGGATGRHGPAVVDSGRPGRTPGRRRRRGCHPTADASAQYGAARTLGHRRTDVSVGRGHIHPAGPARDGHHRTTAAAGERADGRDTATGERSDGREHADGRDTERRRSLADRRGADVRTRGSRESNRAGRTTEG